MFAGVLRTDTRPINHAGPVVAVLVLLLVSCDAQNAYMFLISDYNFTFADDNSVVSVFACPAFVR